MAREIEKIYNPNAVEDKWYDRWREKGYFHARVNRGKKPYTIVIPPPNVTDKLHMGHAFNNTIQDILIRWKRKAGYEALWVPGTDHAGIATQAVVERDLKKQENKTRHDLGRDAFLKRVWAWKEKHGNTITSQLKKLGCSLDWERERFTMDEGLSKAVQQVFIRLYEKGLVYKGLRIVNWDPASGTALADDEVDHKEVRGKLYHIRYKLKDSDEYIVVATTRPETLLGDSGVAVAPDDEEKQHLVGRQVIIPFVERPVTIFSDAHVDKAFGTGFVKATPAHDPNDFEMGQRHHLDQIIMLDKNGKVLPVCRRYHSGAWEEERPVPAFLAGLDRFEARKKIIEALDEMGQLVKVEEHTHAVGHSYRSHVPIEPYLSEQWFVKMEPLARKALEVVENGTVKFHPAGRFENTYRHWMTNIRDWCISRQLWWGHRIPAWYNEQGEIKVCVEDPSTEDEKWTRDPDVLDTWFSSQLWPFSTLGWPEKTPELDYFYPTSTLVTGPDIIFFWVARMIMAGLEFMGDVPFKDVFFNGIVRDAQGRKMSKSLGNGIDPLEMVDKFSADAVRFTLIMMSAEGQDLNLSEKSFETGRNFSNKIWNAFRFLSMNLDDDFSTDITGLESGFETADRWILSQLQHTIEAVTRHLEQFRFHDALETVYHFFWGAYCDWYLEMIKPRLYRPESEEQRLTARRIAAHVMKTTMELMHPVIPFITEEIWQYFKNNEEESVMVAPWPVANPTRVDDEAEMIMAFVREAIGALRNIRTEMNVPLSKSMTVFVEGDDETVHNLLDNTVHFNTLAKVDSLSRAAAGLDKSHCATVVVRGVELFVPLAGLIDVEKEKARLQKEINRLQGLAGGIRRKLENKNFTEKAPTAVVEGERNKLANILENLEKVQANYAKFQ
ncbi:MAG: valine--tRNA ligase [Calditrichaeota bacterium]|nr:MAG: valine--tRNA ligase [Calditrichota bacterium]